MVKQSGIEYDLVIRIRPDKVMDTAFVFERSWVDICSDCYLNKKIYADVENLFLMSGYGVGDQVAFGSQYDMEAYANAWSLTKLNAERGKSDGAIHGLPLQAKPHTTLAMAVMHDGILVKSMKRFFSGLSPPCDPERISMRRVYSAIKLDVSARAQADEMDNRLLEATRVSIES